MSGCDPAAVTVKYCYMLKSCHSALVTGRTCYSNCALFYFLLELIQSNTYFLKQKLKFFL